MVWWVLYAVAVLLLLLHWGSRNAVWGTATLGFLTGAVVAFFRDGFDWWTVAKITTIVTLVGVVIEWVPRIANRRHKSPDVTDN